MTPTYLSENILFKDLSKKVLLHAILPQCGKQCSPWTMTRMNTHSNALIYLVKAQGEYLLEGKCQIQF